MLFRGAPAPSPTRVRVSYRSAHAWRPLPCHGLRLTTSVWDPPCAVPSHRRKRTVNACVPRRTGHVRTRRAHYILFLTVTQTYQPHGSPRPAHIAVEPCAEILGRLFDDLARAQTCEPVVEDCEPRIPHISSGENFVMMCPRCWPVWRSFAMISQMQLQAGIAGRKAQRSGCSRTSAGVGTRTEGSRR
jgi:hypothetical protein